MANESGPGAAQRERLSALVDGELGASEVARACADWREDPALRSDWHCFQLIGDVLRSEDLAAQPARDAAFLSAVRGRLACEPVVLAPESAVVPADETPAVPVRAVGGRQRRWAWMAPSAVAAGFVAVAGVLVVTRSPAPADARLAVSPSSSSVVTVAAMPVSSTASATVQTANGQLIRDSRLDRYLNAHKQFAGSTVLGVPSGFLRNAAAEAPNR